jgi:flagellar biosynthesis/type III secretory pathway M-ring protein FliF/YscJ
LELPTGTEQGQLEGQTEGSTSMTVGKIKVADDPRREELIRIAQDHKELVVQIIRSWLNEERQRLREEMGGKQSEAL